MSIHILIVDRYALVRAGLRLLLTCDQELEIVGEAANGQQALAQAPAAARFNRHGPHAGLPGRGGNLEGYPRGTTEDPGGGPHERR